MYCRLPIICGVGQGAANAFAANGIEAVGAGGPGVHLGGYGRISRRDAAHATDEPVCLCG
jgi:hypothetical protein